MKLTQEDLELQVLKHLITSSTAVAKAQAMGISPDHLIFMEEGSEISYTRQLLKFIYGYFNDSSGSLVSFQTLESKMIENNIPDEHRGKLTLYWAMIEDQDYDENDLHNLLTQIQGRKALSDFNVLIKSVPAQMGQDGGLQGTIDYVMAESEKIRRQFDTDNDSVKVLSINESADFVEQEYTRRKNSPKGILTGYPQIDEETFGIQPGELWCLVAPTGGGKSLHMLNMGMHAHHVQGKNVLYLSFEMPLYECHLRHISAYFRAPFKQLIGCQYEEEPFQNLLKQVRGLGDAPNYFLYDATMKDPTPEYVEAQIRFLERERVKPDLLICDYIGKMTTRDVRRDAKPYERGEAAYDKMHTLVNDFTIAGLTAQQINRGAATERKKAKESGKSYMFDQSSVAGGQAIMNLSSYVFGVDPVHESGMASIENVKSRRVFVPTFGVRVIREFNLVEALSEEENGDFLRGRGLMTDDPSEKDYERATPTLSRSTPGKVQVETLGEKTMIDESELTIDFSKWGDLE